MKIAAGFVLYRPNKVRFLECLQIVKKQFEEIIIFDNVGDMGYLFQESNNIIYITEQKNKGIAYGLNQIMKRAQNDNFNWVVTLDQDTLVPEDLVKYFSEYIQLENVAIISPQVVDKRRPYLNVNKAAGRIKDVDFCITSASCTNVSIWEEVEGFDEWLFIDFVDNDYCKRVRLAGYRILQLQHVVIDQEFGNIRLKSPNKVKFYLWLSKITHNKNVAKLTYHKEVSALRVYYVHRNLLYLNKKFKDLGGIGYDNFYCRSFMGFLFYFTLPSIIRGKKRIKILKSVIQGLRDGYNS